jgi:serine/threonine-protein kinase
MTAPEITGSIAGEIELEQPFPGYTVTERLGRGGSAAVFRAKDSRLDREVAIKALIPDLEHNEDAVENFFNEARNVARLRHPNVVRGLDVGRAGKYFYFAMEYVRGESLAQKLERLERGRLGEEEALRIVRETAVGLQYIFENGLVHRDLKPGNLLLSAEGGVKICDLGVAREVVAPRQEDFVKASPAYASPEQARGDFDIDIRADLYGLGCTWFQMLTGNPPFQKTTPEETLRAHLEEEPANLRELDPRLSAATSQLVLWLLEKDRDNRPRTPQDFLRKLDKHPLREKLLQQESAAQTPVIQENNDDEN